MRFEDLSWIDVESYLQLEDRVILVVGACEQHGYLSLLTDVKIPLALADLASQRSGILVAPPLNFGVSPYFTAYPGTISLRLTTFLVVLEDVVRSLYSQGFRRILILNGHGGNIAARAHLQEMLNELHDLKIIWYDWWLSKRIEVIAQKHELKPAHANWLEAFPFTRVSSEQLPAETKVPPQVPSFLLDAQQVRLTYEDGAFGGPYQVSEEIMHEILNAALEEVLHLIRDGFDV
ncbi:MAG: creatininase family protein [Anaerolineales bacterium]